MTILAESDYPLLNLFWTMFIFFVWVLWFCLLFSVFGDLFRRTDISGWGKAGWAVGVIVLPYLGVFIYLVVEGKAMAERRQRDVRAYQQQVDDRIRSVASENLAADQIAKGKQLLDSGAISAEEFEQLKQRALA
jgi:hypothetical protein